MASLDWEKARLQDRTGPAPRRLPSSKKARGISNTQAKELAHLQRSLGIPYSGQGMTQREASRTIVRLRSALRKAISA
jgi:hypothetical protein